MSRWDDQLINSAFTGTWAQLKDLADDEELDEKSEDSATATELARLRKVLAYLDAIHRNIDPQLMPNQLLQGMDQHAQKALGELNNYKNNGNVGHLQNANNNLDHLITIFHQTPFGGVGQEDGAFGDAAESFIKSLDSYVEVFSEKINSSLSGLKGEITSLSTAVEAASAGVAEVKGDVKVVKQTIEKQTAEFNKQFQDGEEKRTERFDKQVDKLDTKIDKEFQNVAGKAAVILEVLAQLKNDAEKVYGVTIGTLQAGAYSSYATEEGKTANSLRRFAVVLMIIGVLVLVGPEILKIMREGLEYAVDWRLILGRAPVSLILFVPAFYLARESGRHRKNEIVNRRRQHILSTIDPYLALLDPVRAEEIKEHVAKSIFTEGDVPGQDDSDQSANIMAQFANLVKQIKG